MKIVILGSATVIAPIVDALGYPIIAVLNDNISVGDTEGRFGKHLITGTSRDLWTYLKDEDVKLAFTIMTMKKKREVWDKFINLGIPGDKLATLIHPTAIIPQRYCKYGKIIMAPLAQLSPGVEVKDRCVLFGNSFIGHDSTLEEAVVVANNASIQAWVHIGKGVHVGSNSTILSGIQIGEFAVVGAGAVVTKDVLPDTIVAGVPAKRLKHD